MKRRGLIFVLTALMVFGAASLCFADSGKLELKSTYPKDGQTNTSIENVGVKLYFNNSVSGKEARKSNAKAVKIVDTNGKAIPIKVLTSDDESGLVLVLGDNTDKDFKVKNNSEYKLVIDKDFVDDNGNTLGKEKTVKFKTFNQKMNNTINMVMMFAMFGGIIFLTIRQTKKQNEEKEVVETKKENFNPYKEAKRTGKSIEEVMAAEKKRQAKLDKKRKKKGIDKEADHDIDPAELLSYVYKAPKPRTIASAGSTYKSGRGKKDEEVKKTSGAKRGGKKK